jgi:hypothetical protein
MPFSLSVKVHTTPIYGVTPIDKYNNNETAHFATPT